MCIYNVGYDSYEESEYIQLYHEKEFSQQKFEEIVIEATILVLKEDKENYINRYKELKEKGDDILPTVTFQDILHSVVEALVKSFGFKKVKFTGDFNVFGWADILDEKEWEHDRDELLRKLTERARKGLEMKNGQKDQKK